MIFRTLYCEIKWFLQRGRRGWADRDTWSMDSYLERVIPGMLIRLANAAHGYPCQNKTCDKQCYSCNQCPPQICDSCKCQEEWEAGLLKTATIFRYLQENPWDERCSSAMSGAELVEESKKDEQMRKEALEWLFNNWESLWD